MILHQGFIYWSCSMDLLPLLQVLSDGQFHSGEQLGANLSLSRSAVWKQVERLRELGVEVHSVTGKGYRLPTTFDLLSRDIILANLGGGAAEWERCFDVLFTVGSTNAEAMRLAQGGTDRYAIIAEHQTQGRGRRGRVWVSPLGANIYFSMIVSFQMGIGALEGLSLAVALYVVRALEMEGVTGLGVKWPNDILLGGRKLAGILLEVCGDMAGPCKVVIGLGLNVKMPKSASADIDQPYTDLTAGFSGRPDRNKIVATVITQLTRGLEQFNVSGFGPLQPHWDTVDVYRNEMVEIRAGSNVTQGKVMGVSNSGALLLETLHGLKVITGGELMPSMRPISGDVCHDS